MPYEGVTLGIAASNSKRRDGRRAKKRRRFFCAGKTKEIGNMWRLAREFVLGSRIGYERSSRRPST